MNYIVVLFKNKSKKKIIKKFKTFVRAQKFYNDLISESQNVIFSTHYENGRECSFELGLLGPRTKNDEVMYSKDSFGRQFKITLEDERFNIIQINDYNIDEEFLVYSNKEKINTNTFIKKYLKGDGLKMISKLNNKIILQIDDKIELFTFKTDDDSSRFIDNLSSEFLNKKRGDCLFVKDVSTPQRKYLYELLVNYGFPKQYLFRHSTTYRPRT